MIGRLAALAALGLSLSACATVTRGTTTKFEVSSTPPGAAVRTSTGFTCPATPCTFKMPRKDSFEVSISMEGFTTAHVQVRSRMSGAGAAGLAGNVLVGGIIGMGVDATSGALNDLEPNPLQVTLLPAEPARPAADPVPTPIAEDPQ